MLKSTRKLTLAFAALVSALAFAFATEARPQTQAKKCATATAIISSKTPRPGDELTASFAVQNCAAEKERVVVHYSYTDPCGNTTSMGSAPLRLEAGEKQDATISFLAPAPECAGDFKVTAKLMADGKELNSASTTFKVLAQ